MIYSNGYQSIRLACDECEGEPENVGFLTFKEAFLWAKGHNWSVTRETKTGDWSHICPDCAREMGLLPPDDDDFQPTMPQTSIQAKRTKYT